MNLYRFSFLVIALFFSMHLSAQDRHFTQFNHSPLTLNPAFTGAFEGTARIGGIFRDQTPGMSNLITTPSFYIDAPLLLVRKRDWVSLGIVFYTDIAGPALSKQYVHFTGAYHLSLNKKQTNVLTLGISGGTINHRFDNSADNRWPELGSDGLNNMTDGFVIGENSQLDINAGLLFKAKLNKVTNIQLGFSLNHFIKFDSTNINLYDPTMGFTPNYALPTLFTLHGEYDVDLNKQWIASPKFMYQKVSNHDEGVTQFLLGYRLLKREIRDNGKKGKLIQDKDAPIARFGLGYRFGDALQVLLGYEVKGFRAGIAYDLTVSSKSDIDGGNGAFELAASYILKIYKKPDVDPAILCPKF